MFAINSERCGLPTASLMLFTVSLCLLLIIGKDHDGEGSSRGRRIRMLPARAGIALCFNHPAENLTQVQDPLLEQAKEARLIVTASPGGSRARNLTAGHVID